jgi:Uma2 family endonuclease
MGVPLRKQTLAEFLAWEKEQLDRHEFCRGEMFAVVGGKRGHGRVISNLVRHLGNQLDGTPCQVFSEGMKVLAGDDAFHPDVFISCDREFSADQLTFETPILVIEVLSPSTEAYDRGRKRASYRQLASLREYVLIDPDSRSIEVYRRDTDGAWGFSDLSQQAALELASVGCAVAAVDLFKGMDSK